MGSRRQSRPRAGFICIAGIQGSGKRCSDALGKPDGRAGMGSYILIDPDAGDRGRSRRGWSWSQAITIARSDAGSKALIASTAKLFWLPRPHPHPAAPAVPAAD